jgi:phosphoglycerate-specific signal transduction histidine kinase
MPLLAGCATGGNQIQNTVYSTHRHVANLEQNLQGSVQQLNQTAAGLLARVDANDQALRGVAGRLEENRAKLDTLEQRLDALIRTCSRQQQRALPAPGSPTGRSEVEISDQDFVVEDPDGAVRR